MTELVQIKRALLSVSDKTHLEKLAKVLFEMNVEIVSSGGTAKFINDLGIDVTPIEKVTGNPEAFAGRMKTLSFQVSSALLFRRDSENDLKEAKELNIEPIDLVVCNLYPFEKVARENADFDVLIENIDIGGPTMVRASAKNFKHVTVSTNPEQYDELIKELSNNKGSTSLELRKKFSLKAYQHTASYDSLIASELECQFGEEVKTIGLSPEKARELRYGENPHQKAWVYEHPTKSGLAGVIPSQGKALSYNNLLDADAAWRSSSDLLKLIKTSNLKYKSAVTIIKHSNPCGAAISSGPLKALEMAWSGDPISSFGSIICFTDEVDFESASWLSDKFVEVILAPSFSAEAKEKFAKKKNLRLLEIAPMEGDYENYMVKAISGGWVVQTEDNGLDREFITATDKKLNDDQMNLANFGTMVAKHLRSNAIALVKEADEGLLLIGGGMGNPNRLISLDQAVNKANENGHKDLTEAILISDAFFPFRDNIDLANKSDIKYIVQPGGSIRDKEVVEACNEHGMAMVFTGRRHFRH
jgi:phosphoribosylaminoimidazolecarboxamide formyltransferase/IMP cyclohydrolase